MERRNAPGCMRSHNPAAILLPEDIKHAFYGQLKPGPTQCYGVRTFFTAHGTVRGPELYRLLRTGDTLQAMCYCKDYDGNEEYLSQSGVYLFVGGVLLTY